MIWSSCHEEVVLLKCFDCYTMKDESYTKPILQNSNEFKVKYILDTKYNIDLLNKDARTKSRV